MLFLTPVFAALALLTSLFAILTVHQGLVLNINQLLEQFSTKYFSIGWLSDGPGHYKDFNVFLSGPERSGRGVFSFNERYESFPLLSFIVRSSAR